MEFEIVGSEDDGFLRAAHIRAGMYVQKHWGPLTGFSPDFVNFVWEQVINAMIITQTKHTCLHSMVYQTAELKKAAYTLNVLQKLIPVLRAGKDDGQAFIEASKEERNAA